MGRLVRPLVWRVVGDVTDTRSTFTKLGFDVPDKFVEKNELEFCVRHFRTCAKSSVFAKKDSKRTQKGLKKDSKRNFFRPRFGELQFCVRHAGCKHGTGGVDVRGVVPKTPLHGFVGRHVKVGMSHTLGHRCPIESLLTGMY